MAGLFDVIGDDGVRPRGNRGRPENEKLPTLRGDRWIRQAQEMVDNSDVVGGSLMMFENTVGQVSWHAREIDSRPRSVLEAEFIASVFGDMLLTFHELMADILTFLPFGSSLFEINYKQRRGSSPDHNRHSKYSDGRIGLRDLGYRPQETLKEWMWFEDGTLAGVFQHVPALAEYVFIPSAKFALFKTRASRRFPQGKAMIRPLWRTWNRLKIYEDIEGVGYDRNLQGVVVLRLPAKYHDKSNTDPDVVAARLEYTKMLMQYHRNEMTGFTFPASEDRDGKTGFDFEIKSVDTANIAVALGTAIGRLQRQIATGMNTQFQWLGQGHSSGGSGSRAVSGDQMDMYILASESILDIAQAVLDQYVVQPLYEMNGVPEEFRAKWVHDPVSRDDLKQFADNMKTLMDAQAVRRGPKLEAYTHEKMGYPAPEEEDPSELDVGVEDIDNEVDPADVPPPEKVPIVPVGGKPKG